MPCHLQVTDGPAVRPPLHHHSVFGLCLASELELPELRPVAAAPGDVSVRIGRIPDDGTGDEARLVNGGVLLPIEGIGRFWISGGRTIIVDPDPDTPERNVRLFLLGSALGILLHQRGMLPLHANAVEIDGRAVAFMGPSGEGKSTLAAWFHDRGYRVFADDVCVITCDGSGPPLAHPGIPRLRLWKDVLEATGRDARLFERSYRGDDSYDKFDVPIEEGNAVAEPLELAAIVLLDRGEVPDIGRLTGLDAAEALFANTYRGAFVALTDNTTRHWQSALSVVGRVPVLRARRRRVLESFTQEAHMILAHVRSLCSSIPSGVC